MEADDGLSGAGVVTEQPEWVDGLPYCGYEDCGAYDGKRCRLLGFPPARSTFCEPALDALREGHRALRLATRALLAKLDAYERARIVTGNGPSPYAPELEAVRKAVGG